MDYMVGWVLGFGFPLIVVLGSFGSLLMRRK